MNENSSKSATIIAPPTATLSREKHKLQNVSSSLVFAVLGLLCFPIALEVSGFITGFLHAATNQTSAPPQEWGEPLTTTRKIAPYFSILFLVSVWKLFSGKRKDFFAIVLIVVTVFMVAFEIYLLHSNSELKETLLVAISYFVNLLFSTLYLLAVRRCVLQHTND